MGRKGHTGATPAAGPERALAAVGLAGGLAVLVILPPFQAPDEPAHFFRACEISEGQLVSKKRGRRVGASLPTSLVPVVQVADGIPFHPEKRQDRQAVRALFSQTLASDDRVFLDFPNTAVHSPVPYLTRRWESPPAATWAFRPSPSSTWAGPPIWPAGWR